ncbi:MAG: hypothetical protein L6R40_001545 [Gallowayella cf. fulva]|nr:MAG: hypothetical protein L6R40_001545 [Xanthomendoza cf. fulva]
MIPTLALFGLLVVSAACSPVHTPLRLPVDKRADILSTINGWRYALGANPLSWSQEMADAAANTGQMNGGGQTMNHNAPDGAAEVISPGSDTDYGQDLHGRSPFEISLIGWLCEVPSSQMGDACRLVDVNNKDAVMMLNLSGTGHHDILVDNRYKKIGCAFTKRQNPDGWFLSQGQWVCDLTF